MTETTGEGMERRELHLHVGLPKTGTTFLQNCLDLNRAAIEAQGFALAPLMDAGGAHHDLAYLARDRGAEVLAEVLRNAPGRRIVASSEVFSDQLADPGAAAALHRALAPHFDVTLYMVLRRQDFMKESAYAEMAKVHSRLGPIRVEPAQTSRTLLYDNPDLDRRLTIVEATFGLGNVKVAIYNDAVRQDSFEQFCTMLSLAPCPPGRPEREANVSLTRRKTLLLANVAKDDQRLAREVLRCVQGSRRIAPDDGKFLLSPAERRQVVAQYLKGNRRIVARYGLTDGDWLTALPDGEDAGWTPAAPIRDQEFLMIYLSLVRRALRAGRLRDAAAFTALIFGAARHARAVARRSAEAASGAMSTPPARLSHGRTGERRR